MPELPEVETTLRGIKPFVDNAVITNIEVRNASLRWPVPSKALSELIGERVKSCTRRAKYLVITTDVGSILLHLGMSGSLRALPTGTPAGKHDHIDIEFNNESILRLNDPRRFGCCLFTKEKIENHKLIKHLGPEPLSDDFNAEMLYKKSRKRSLSIKNFIMDGKVVVGVGNIYASESLFLAGIHPSTKAGSVSKVRYLKLTEIIKQVLAKAIQAGGTTLNDFSQVDGKPGYFAQELNVYGRAGEACVECSAEIKSMLIGQRNTFYCAICQKR